jgi:hypothetical protein
MVLRDAILNSPLRLARVWRKGGHVEARLSVASSPTIEKHQRELRLARRQSVKEFTSDRVRFDIR